MDIEGPLFILSLSSGLAEEGYVSDMKADDVMNPDFLGCSSVMNLRPYAAKRPRLAPRNNILVDPPGLLWFPLAATPSS